MANIQVVEITDKDLWEKKQSSCINFNIFSLFEWGDYKNNSWKALRLFFHKEKKFIGCVQILMKEKLGLKVGWSSGGINYTDQKYLKDILISIDRYFKGKIYNIRLSFNEKLTGESLFKILEQRGIKKAFSSVNSGFTVLCNLSEITDLKKEMTSNHRYYYKKSLPNDLKFIAEDCLQVESFIGLHNEMMNLKKGLKLKPIDGSNLERLKLKMGNKLKQYSVYFKGELVSSCLILQEKENAFYYLAATSTLGRQLFSSFFMIYELLYELKNQNIRFFDFGGIDPLGKKTQGVNRFKAGFGGEIIKNVGEFDLYGYNWVRKMFNAALKVKGL
tara:strand:+ start:419 stop:1411 length:993 start_codon:yes stop_codon:yes gene_type:complete